MCCCCLHFTKVSVPSSICPLLVSNQLAAACMRAWLGWKTCMLWSHSPAVSGDAWLVEKHGIFLVLSCKQRSHCVLCMFSSDPDCVSEPEWGKKTRASLFAALKVPMGARRWASVAVMGTVFQQEGASTRLSCLLYSPDISCHLGT